MKKQNQIPVAPMQPSATPTTSELATLAASLAHGTTIDAGTAKAFGLQALKLWQACRELAAHGAPQTETEQCRADAAERWAKACAGIPKPKQFPVSLTEFLRLTLGGRSKEKRESVFQDFLAHKIKTNRALQRGPGTETKPATPRQLNEEMTWWSAQQFDALQFDQFALQILKWLEPLQAEAKRDKASKAAKARHGT